MSRLVKQIIYGAIFVFFFGFIIFSIITSAFKSAPSCFDGIQNQNETGIDCGGVCVLDCSFKNIQPLRQSAPVKIFDDGLGRAVFLAEVINPNDNYGVASVFYKFLVYNSFGRVAETLSGQESFYPSQKKYIFESQVKTQLSNISKVALELLRPEWQSAHEFLMPNLSAPQNVKTDIVNNRIQVSGSLRNLGPITARDVKILAIIFDKVGNPLFASQTVIADLAGFKESPFVIFFPTSQFLSFQADLSAVKIFVTSK